MTRDSADKFVKMINKSGHLSVLEHFSITAIVVCSRACSHQLVRHRIAAYSQESQRYCNYGKNDSLKVICPKSIGLEPRDWESGTGLTTLQEAWIDQIESAYQEYKSELANGIRPEDARYILPNATKTELAVTYNVRQWKHFFGMRCSKHAQWEIRDIATLILDDLNQRFPSVFGEKA